MANNRLYIEDTETGYRLFVAKSFGGGWEWLRSADEINAWISAKPRDEGASFGNTDSSPSRLRFITENDPTFELLRAKE
jgi:hypothetical protein